MENDKAGVIAPPPVIAVVTIIAAIVAEQIAPSRGWAGAWDVAWTVRLLVGAGPVLAGLALAVVGERRFSAAGTDALPWRPASALVTDGVYAHVRNPMYLGLGLVMIGLSVVTASAWLLVLTVPAAVVLHVGVVLREERYLTRKFGDAYRDYMGRVPRYLPRVVRRAY